MSVRTFRSLLVVLLTGACVAGQPGRPPPEAARPTPPASYLAAKRIAEDRIYPDHRITLYCGCGFTEDKQILPDACGYEPRNDGPRARRMEWVHVVPASRLGSDRVCWQERERFPECVRDDGSLRRGRDCCRTVDPEFRAMEAELHNLGTTSASRPRSGLSSRRGARGTAPTCGRQNGTGGSRSWKAREIRSCSKPCDHAGGE